MSGALERLLARYGQTVELRREGGSRVVLAFLQPVLERREDWRDSLVTPLGEVRRERFLYLGPPEEPLEGTTVVWRGAAFAPVACRAVFVGQVCSHQWAVLRALGDVGSDGG